MLIFSGPAPMDVAAIIPAQQPDQGSQNQADDPNQVLDKAARLIAGNRAQEARPLLEALESGTQALAPPQANQLRFLLGLLDLQDGNYKSATRYFRRILVDDPHAVRVRLELGRTYFLANDFNNAERQFRFARAGKLPSTVKANVDRYLAAIRVRRTLSYNLSLAVATDSNANAGPATDAISLYGLPFQLSQSAKANSGFAIALDGGVEWSPKLDEHVRWRLGVQVHRVQYRRTQFDDMTVSAYIGPHVSIKRWDLNLLGLAGRRWYADRVYTDLYGLSADATYFATARLGIGGSASVIRFAYPLNRLQNATGGNVSANLFYTPTTASVIRFAAALGWQNAMDPAYSSAARQFNLTYTREFRGGITLTLSPTFTHIGYRAPLTAFNAVRKDRQFTGQLSVLDRRIDLGGFTPRIILTYTRNDSSIPLYSFDRRRIEFGVTSAF